MIKLHALKTETPIGDFWMIMERKTVDVVRLSGFGELLALTKRLPEELAGAPPVVVSKHPYQELVVAYFNGDKKALDKIPHRQDGSEFATKIWQTIEKITYGATISYGQLAALSGKPNTARAAGTVCKLNKLVLLTPCHRIVKSNGQLGEYLYGAKIKEHLLKIEGAL